MSWIKEMTELSIVLVSAATFYIKVYVPYKKKEKERDRKDKERDEDIDRLKDSHFEITGRVEVLAGEVNTITQSIVINGVTYDFGGAFKVKLDVFEALAKELQKQHPEIGRVLLFAGTNGVALVKRVWCLKSILNESDPRHKGSINSQYDYFGFPVPYEYGKMVEALFTKGGKVFITESMKLLFLKELYLSEGVEWSRAEAIGTEVINNNNMKLFMSQAGYNNEQLSVVTHDAIARFTEQIRELFAR